MSRMYERRLKGYSTIGNVIEAETLPLQILQAPSSCLIGSVQSDLARFRLRFSDSEIELRIASMSHTS